MVLLFTWFLVALARTPVSLSGISRRTWVFLILSGLAAGLSWICYFRSLQLGLASKLAPIDKLSVIFVIALSALFLHESVSWQQWTGGFLIPRGAVILASF